VVTGPPGKGAGKHRHPYADIFVVLGGSIEVTVGDETRQCLKRA
jgi:quercetin dioxygenase-like cupin family protein